MKKITHWINKNPGTAFGYFLGVLWISWAILIIVLTFNGYLTR